jgi:hypothetical protein
MSSTTTKSQTLACTLTEGDLRNRRAWIAELTRDGLRGYDRVDLVLRLRYAPEAAPRVRAMMHKERACCEFLAFEMHQEPGEVWLTITAPEEARMMADALFEPFLPPR